MISTAEEIIVSIRSLPEFEREKVFQLVEAEKKIGFKNGGDSKLKDEKFKLSLKWIHEHCQEYDGQWVALDGELLLAHGFDGRKVHSEAQTKGVKMPLIHRVSIKETMPFGGW